MARTRLRGIELAGIRMAVESPPAFSWNWPERGLAALACAPTEADVYVGVTVGDAALPRDLDAVTYSFDGGTFDVGRAGPEWVIAVHGRRQRCERIARFGGDWSEGEIVVAPSVVERCEHPLAGPVLDLILIQRIIGAGGLVVEGTAMVEDGRALALIAAQGTGVAAGDASRGWQRVAAPGRTFTPGERFALVVREDSVRVHGLPGPYGHPATGVSGRLDAIHVVSRSSRMFADTLSGEIAASVLLEHAFAPVHDPACAEQLMAAAARTTARVPVMRLGLPEEERVVPFAWGRRQASLGFAPPLAS